MNDLIGHSITYRVAMGPRAGQKVFTLRGAITPAGRGPGAKAQDAATERSPCKHLSMTWAQRLKRLFAIEIERCLPAP